METKFELKGAEQLAKTLNSLGFEVAQKIAKRAVRAGGKVIVAEAKRLVPVESGELQASITVVDDKQASDEFGSGVLIGFFKPTSSRAHLTEFGTAHSPAKPFMRPALDSKANDALGEMKRVLARGIKNAARKHRTK